MKSAIILCSGGIDSVTLAHHIKKELKYDSLKFLFFNYSQKSLDSERKASQIHSENLGADFKEIKLPELTALSTSLINVQGEAKKLSLEDLKDSSKESNKYYVPSRNLIFLSYALALAEKDHIERGIKQDIFIGFKNEGSESYPDTSKDFLESIEKVSKISTKGKYSINAPLIEKDKEDIISLAKVLGVDLKNTFSCYLSNTDHCGYCLSCRLRQEGFYWANIEDQTIYLEKPDDFRKA